MSPERGGHAGAWPLSLPVSLRAGLEVWGLWALSRGRAPSGLSFGLGDVGGGDSCFEMWRIIKQECLSSGEKIPRGPPTQASAMH